MAHTRVMVGRPVSQSVVSSKLNSVSDLFFFFFLSLHIKGLLACLLVCCFLRLSLGLPCLCGAPSSYSTTRVVFSFVPAFCVSVVEEIGVRHVSGATS
ncbi:hypothetical protein HDK77DRAFT_458496 [Phyllosticta capitalensis]